MIVYRLSREEHDPLAWRESRSFRDGFRWNEPGVPVVYASQDSSTAILEMMVHALEALASGLFWIHLIELPKDGPIQPVAELPETWDQLPDSPVAQAHGSRLLRSLGALAWLVPSVVNPHAHNVLISPKHPLFPRVRIIQSERYQLDPRIARQFGIEF